MTVAHSPNQESSTIINGIRPTADTFEKSRQVFLALVCICSKLSVHVGTIILKCREARKLASRHSPHLKTKHSNSLALVEAQSSSFTKFRPGFTTTPRTEGAIYMGTREGGRKEKKKKKKHKTRLPSCKVSHETNVQSNSRAGEESTFASTAGVHVNLQNKCVWEKFSAHLCMFLNVWVNQKQGEIITLLVS